MSGVACCDAGTFPEFIKLVPDLLGFCAVHIADQILLAVARVDRGLGSVRPTAGQCAMAFRFFFSCIEVVFLNFSYFEILPMLNPPKQ